MIVIAFIIPVILFFVIRRVRANRRRQLRKGEVFDKDGEIYEVKEGSRIRIKHNIAKGLKIIEEGEKKNGSSIESLRSLTNGKKKTLKNKHQILFFYEDESKRKIKPKPPPEAADQPKEILEGQ